jgi:hypothetical protein
MITLFIFTYKPHHKRVRRDGRNSVGIRTRGQDIRYWGAGKFSWLAVQFVILYDLLSSHHYHVYNVARTAPGLIQCCRSFAASILKWFHVSLTYLSFLCPKLIPLVDSAPMSAASSMRPFHVHDDVLYHCTPSYSQHRGLLRFYYAYSHL